MLCDLISTQPGFWPETSKMKANVNISNHRDVTTVTLTFNYLPEQSLGTRQPSYLGSNRFISVFIGGTIGHIYFPMSLVTQLQDNVKAYVEKKGLKGPKISYGSSYYYASVTGFLMSVKLKYKSIEPGTWRYSKPQRLMRPSAHEIAQIYAKA